MAIETLLSHKIYHRLSSLYLETWITSIKNHRCGRCLSVFSTSCIRSKTVWHGCPILLTNQNFPFWLQSANFQKKCNFLKHSFLSKSWQHWIVVANGLNLKDHVTTPQCWFFAPKLCIFRNLEKIQTASRSLNKVPFDRFFNGAPEISKHFTHF